MFEKVFSAVKPIDTFAKRLRIDWSRDATKHLIKFSILCVHSSAVKISFSTFRQSFASTTSYLKRRFSSGDLSGEEELEPNDQQNAQPKHNEIPPQQTEFVARGPSSATSAPTSPLSAKSTVSAFLSRATSITGSVTSTVQQTIGQRVSQKQKILLVIDDPQTDWSKYFRGKRIYGEWDIRVEQSEFRDISLSSSSDSGCVVSVVTTDRSGAKCARTFRPDFVFIRQHIRDVKMDFRDVVLGLKFGGVPSINSLNSLYNCQDRPWIFSQLIGIQRRLGKDSFPLIEQTFHSNHRETCYRFPCVLKIGHVHGGFGRVKCENPNDFNDLMSVYALTETYCTVEPFIDAKCDLHIQKIANNYKCYARKSVSGNWKTNIGASIIEQIPMNDRFKKWIDEISELFGGLEICSVEVIVAKDGREHIIDISGSEMTLYGDSQEEDRRMIADLITVRMQNYCRPIVAKQSSRTSSITETATEPMVMDNVEQSGEGIDDTMRNLRKTFAGIFGEM